MSAGDVEYIDKRGLTFSMSHPYILIPFNDRILGYNQIKMCTNQERMEVETQVGSDSSDIPKQEEHCKLHTGSI